ncbi:MAG TPA: N-acetyl-gamma-glutamyl-phosphate reductase [Vicinamibacterales bacterium]|nr:N-acetyl-gamma-glutamyl-phosphate reductase [Vicinamibacterales bacterium]
MHNYASTASVAMAGASGYAGQELLRLLARHPHARLETAMTSSPDSAARPLPRLSRVFKGELQPLDTERLAGAGTVFLAVPEAASAALVPELLARGVKRIFDLSGAFRLRDLDLRKKWYPATASEPDGLVYGLTELAKADIAAARVVACPGCYPTAALLALQPLADAGLLDLAHGVVIDAKSGISGAGRTPSDRTHFSEVHGSVAAYGIFGHRHTAEIEQQLGADVTFVPHLVPLDRGILETIYARVRPDVTAFEIEAALTAAYDEAPFVRLTGDALPEVKHVAHTNFCDIGWKFDAATRRLVLVSCIDNLIKGAAGQAVQNFNVALGFDETAGLA